MAVEELIVPGVRHGGRVGELHALADGIRFAEVEAEAESVRPDYAPVYVEERDERVTGIEYERIEAVERDGGTVRLRTAGGAEEFAFERETDAESFERLVQDRIRA